MTRYRDRLIEHDIRIAYAEITQGRRHAIQLAAIRAQVSADRADVDRVLSEMGRADGVHLRGEADQKTLTAEDRAAAIVLGGTARHTLLIES